MKTTVDESGIRSRMAEMTMEEAEFGLEDAGRRVQDAFGHMTGAGASLDDVLRLVAAARPFGENVNVAYRWCAEADDERLSSVLLALSPGGTGHGVTGGTCIELPMDVLGSFPGGSVEDAVLHLARAAAAEHAAVAGGGPAQ